MSLTACPADHAPTRRGKPAEIDLAARAARVLVVAERVDVGTPIADLASHYRVSPRTIKRWAATGRRVRAS